MTIDIGQPAPDFSLRDQSGETVSLSDFRGQKAVALVFYPFTFTGICEGELCALRDDISTYEAAGVHRIQAVSLAGYDKTHQWLGTLGLQPETGPLKGYGRHGEDFIQFARLSDVRPPGA